MLGSTWDVPHGAAPERWTRVAASYQLEALEGGPARVERPTRFIPGERSVEHTARGGSGLAVVGTGAAERCRRGHERTDCRSGVDTVQACTVGNARASR